MAPRITVLLNNHNYARYLGEAIDSVLRQDFPPGDVEIIAVDDGSTDGSQDALARRAPRVEAVYLLENRGQAAAFNAGLAAARGGIVCLLDSDDWWAPGKLSAVAARFEREPDLGMVQHWCREIGPDGKPFAARFPPLPERWTAEDFLAGRAIFTGTTGLSFRAEALRRLLPLPEDLRICADNYLYYSILDFPVGNIPEVLAFRRVHGENRYAGRFRDPARLAEHRRALAVLDRELERLLRGRALPTPLRDSRRAEALLDELFLARGRGDWSEARRLWHESLASRRGATRLAKAATLTLLLASPTLYLLLQGLYARLRNG